MSGSFLLDTNIVIALFNNDLTVQQRLWQAKEIYITNVVLGIYYGAINSIQTESNIAQIDKFSFKVAVLFCDSITAKIGW